MAEPKASYDGLEESSSFLNPRLQQMVVTLLILSILFSVQDSVDALPTSNPSLNRKDVNQTRQSLMMIERSMPNDDDLSSSSDYESLPLTVECSSDQYLDQSGVCRNCTTCGPGTQHGQDKRCGYGNGFEQICEPCDEGYYQDRKSSSLVRCYRCITCDPLAETTLECSPLHNAGCGKCPPGMHYLKGFPNFCLPCEAGDDSEECMTTKATTPASTTKTAPPSSPNLTTDAVPLDVIVTVSTMIETEVNQTEITPANTTEQPSPGGTKKIGVYVGVTVFVVAFPLLFGACLYKVLKKRCCKNDEESTGEKGNEENRSKRGNPGVISDQAQYNARTEAVVLGGYSPVPQQEPTENGTDLSLPQTLRSDLPFDPPPCVCNGQGQVEPDQGLHALAPAVSIVGQDTPPSRR